MESDCSKCVSKKRFSLNTKSSLLGGLLIIIIPKCPLCIMAYTSAITMCGTETMATTGNNWLSYVPIALSAIIIGLIAFNRRVTRTWFALALAFIASGMILATHQMWVSSNFYNYGTILLFFAIWLNSNFAHTLQFVRQRLFPAH